MTNKNRKMKLGDRAWKYARARFEAGSIQTHTEARAYAFQDGYRAAMRDLRKAIKDPHDGTAEHKRIQMFLRPLR